MEKNLRFAFGLATLLMSDCCCWATSYAISAFPANSILGPFGPAAIPSQVQQFIQSNPSASVSAVNNAGQIVVNIPTNEPASSGYIYVYLPNPAYGLSAGVNLISPTQWGAYSVNNNGQIAGSDGDHWVIWNIGGTESYIGTQPGLAGIAWQVNDSGQAITQDFESGGIGRVYVYSPTAQNGYSAGMTDLTPQGSNYPIPLAIGINNNGDALYDAAPYTYYGDPSTIFQAYLHVGSSHNSLAGGSTYTLSGIGWSMYEAAGLNDSGQVVGMAAFTNGGTSYNDPILWSIRSGDIDLNSLLPANSGWVLQTVTGIDQLGDIEGTGLLNGVETPFLLYAPEPSALWIGVLGLLCGVRVKVGDNAVLRTAAK